MFYFDPNAFTWRKYVLNVLSFYKNRFNKKKKNNNNHICK